MRYFRHMAGMSVVLAVVSVAAGDLPVAVAAVIAVPVFLALGARADARPRPLARDLMLRHPRVATAYYFVGFGAVCFGIPYRWTGRLPLLWAAVGLASGTYSAFWLWRNLRGSAD